MSEMLNRLSENEFLQRVARNPVAKAAAVAVGVLLVGVIAWASLRTPKPVPGPMPDGTPWVCKNGHPFTLTGEQMTEHFTKHATEPVLCPICGQPADRALKCPNCGNVVVPVDHLCPVCKKPINHY